MRKELLLLVVSLALHASCGVKDQNHSAPCVPDIYSVAWRDSKFADAAIQAKAILRASNQVLREHLDAGDYSANTRYFIDEITSGDIERTVDAISLYRVQGYGENRVVPLEIQIALVSPFLSDSRGYYRTVHDPPPCPVRREIGGHISSLSAALLRDRSMQNPSLLPVIANYLAHQDAIPCPTARALIPAVTYSVTEPEDIELAAAILFEIAIRGRWTWIARPWEGGGIEGPCDAHEEALHFLMILKENHPTEKWLMAAEEVRVLKEAYDNDE